MNQRWKGAPLRGGWKLRGCACPSPCQHTRRSSTQRLTPNRLPRTALQRTTLPHGRACSEGHRQQRRPAPTFDCAVRRDALRLARAVHGCSEAGKWVGAVPNASAKLAKSVEVGYSTPLLGSKRCCARLSTACGVQVSLRRVALQSENAPPRPAAQALEAWLAES
jgi:hypothetical protein